MAYLPVLTKSFIPYNIDGTQIGFSNNVYNYGVASWLTQSEKDGLIDGNYANSKGLGMGYYGGAVSIWFFFPKTITIEQMSIAYYIYRDPVCKLLEYSTDTTNGFDGTWVSVGLPNGLPVLSSTGMDSWRYGVKPVTPFTCKALRFQFTGQERGQGAYLYVVHLFGSYIQANDIVFCDNNGIEQNYIDFGDMLESSTAILPIYLKNTNVDKTAQDITITLNHSNFLISLDQITWSTSVNINSLLNGSLSVPIYVKSIINLPNTLGQIFIGLSLDVSIWI